MNYKVCIPAAGLGSRLNELCVNLNKALINVANKPAISHIIDKFPEEVPFVIATGYKGQLLCEFLTLAYPKRTFEFVQVDSYQGPGSGLGLSILQCMDLLQCPFIFCSCDTIVTEPVPVPKNNWMGYAEVENIAPYRTIRVKDSQVIEVCEKDITGSDLYAYIGLAGIYNYQEFWQRMLEGKNDSVIEIGESYGLNAIVDNDISPLKFTWFDTGNPQALERTKQALTPENSPNILDKPNEAIWFVDNQVIKFSTDTEFIKKRVARSKILEGFCPEVNGHTEHMYKYQQVDGIILSEVVTVPIFNDLLNYSSEFWQEKKLTAEEKKQFQDKCMVFYKNKTEARIKLFYENFKKNDDQENINGIKMPYMNDLLKKIDWDWLADGLPGNFHGDYHFENILYVPNEKKFCFLDWRQEFGGSLEVGDIYYDFAKLNHGLIIAHDLIRKNYFNVSCDGQNIKFSFYRKNILVECEKVLEEFLEENGYSWEKVQVLTALIFLNIAALHHYPYSLLLYYLGKYSLHQALQN